MLNRRTWRAVALFVTMAAGPASAQTIADSFAELRPLLKKGQTVIVTDASGQRVRGKVAEVSAASLTVLSPEARTFAEAAVTEIRAPAASSRQGALRGLAVGAGIGAALILTKCRNGPDCSYALKVAAGYAGIGMAIGAGIGARSNEDGRILYRQRWDYRLPPSARAARQ